MAPETPWHIRGDILEACSCDVTCPCNFGSNPTQVPCEAVLGWRIQEGQYGNLRLDGLNVVLYVRIPGYLFTGDWTAGVYLDGGATPEKLAGFVVVFSGAAGAWGARFAG